MIPLAMLEKITSGFDWYFVPVVGPRVLFPDHIGTLRTNDDTEASSSLRFAQYRDFAERLDTPGVEGIHCNAYPHRARDAFAAVARRAGAGQRL